MKQRIGDLLGLVLMTVFYYGYVALRPLRALKLAYGYALTGTKVGRPYTWNEI